MMVFIGSYLGGVWETKLKILWWKALLEAVASEGNLSLSPIWTRNCNTTANWAPQGLIWEVFRRQNRRSSALLEAVISRDNNLSLSPTWIRNCYLAANDDLYRDLLGRSLGDKIEDPLLEGLA
jgi:hypothetical protein